MTDYMVGYSSLFICLSNYLFWRIGHFAGFFLHVCLNRSFCRVKIFMLMSQVLFKHVTLPHGRKRSLALLGSNHARDTAAMHTHGRGVAFHGVALSQCGASHALKNPMMNRLRFSSDMPLWLFRFFLRSVKIPSILLFVFGMPAHSRKVNRYGR